MKGSIPLASFWSKESLIKRREEIGERAFERGFRQRAISDSELTFPHFKNCLRYDEEKPKWQFCYTGVDLSTKTRPGNVIFTVAVRDGIKYNLDLRIGEWSSPETAQQIRDVWDKYKPIIIHVENNAYQDALIDWLKTSGFGHLPITAFTTGKQKSDSEIGLPSLDVQFEKEIWRFYVPHHDPGCRCNDCRMVREFNSHPGYSTSDIVMAFWFAERASSKYTKSLVLDSYNDSNSGQKPITSGLRKKIF